MLYDNGVHVTRLLFGVAHVQGPRNHMRSIEYGTHKVFKVYYAKGWYGKVCAQTVQTLSKTGDYALVTLGYMNICYGYVMDYTIDYVIDYEP